MRLRASAGPAAVIAELRLPDTSLFVPAPVLVAFVPLVLVPRVLP